MRRYWGTPEGRAIGTANNRAKAQAQRNRQMASDAQHALLADPERRAERLAQLTTMSAAKWQDPEYRATVSKAVAESNRRRAAARKEK